MPWYRDERPHVMQVIEPTRDGPLPRAVACRAKGHRAPAPPNHRIIGYPMLKPVSEDDLRMAAQRTTMDTLPTKRVAG